MTNGKNNTGFNIIGIPNISISFILNNIGIVATPASFPLRFFLINKISASQIQIAVPLPPMETKVSEKFFKKKDAPSVNATVCATGLSTLLP